MSKKTKILNLLFVLLILLGILLIYVLNNKQPTKTETDKNTSLVTYNAEVGNFRLDLPNSYGVIVNVDGQTQNGDRTVVEIGQNQGDIGVVNSPYLGKAVITATVLNDKSAEDVLDTYSTDEPIISNNTVEIDGVQANLKVIDGEVQKELYYFEHTGIFYVLYFENTNQSDILAKQKDDVIKGFTLTE